MLKNYESITHNICEIDDEKISKRLDECLLERKYEGYVTLHFKPQERVQAPV
jgi:hypothetical protein